MKKNALLILATSALLALAGCSSFPSESSSKSDSSETISSEVVSSELDPIVSSEAISSESSEVSSHEKETSNEGTEDSSEEEAREFDISAESDGGATVTLGNLKASPGAEVHFTVTALTGFKIEEVSARAGSNELDLVVGLDGDYSFTMPKRGVAITVTTSRKSYKLSTNDAGGFLKSVAQKKVGSSSYVPLDTITEESEPDEEGETITSSYKVAQFGAEILLTFNASVANYELTGVTVNGAYTELKAGTESYAFTMKAEDTSVSISYSYKTIAFSLVNSEHITLMLYSDEEGKTEIKDGYIPYKEVYVKATSSNEDYAVKTIVCTYPGTRDGATVTLSNDITSYYDDSLGLYKFTYPMSDGPVTINVTEYNLKAYAGSDFVGDYGVADFSYPSAHKDITSFDAKGIFRIAESGDLTYTPGGSATAKEGYCVSGVDSEANSLTLSQTSSKTTSNAICDGKVVVFDTYLEKGYESTTYISLGVKKANPSATYAIYASQFTIGEDNYIVASFYEGASLIENVLVKRGAKNAVTLDVNVNMLEGDHVSDANAIFRVTKDDSALLSVGYTGAGGANNRVALGEEYGTYTDGDGKLLYLSGSGIATYDGASYGYVLAEDGVTITLNSNDGTVKGTIDKTAKSFAVAEKEEASMPWVGKTYKGVPQYSASEDDASWPYTLTFASSGTTLTWTELIGGRAYYTVENVEYTVENGTAIKTNFYNSANKKDNSSGAPITLTYNASGDYFTATGGFKGAYFKNTKLTLVS